MKGTYIGKKVQRRSYDNDAPRLASLPWKEQDKAYRWMWSVACDPMANENQVWVALDAIVRIWGDRDAQLLLDGYIPEGKFL